MTQLLDKKILMKMKNFRKVLLLDNVESLGAERILKKNKVIIMGFYMQNVFFFFLKKILI